MVYIKNLLNICNFKKIQIHLQVFLLFKSTGHGYNGLKIILDIFHSLDWF
jgi:hypothetical protein